MTWKKIKLKKLLSRPVQNGYSPICPETPNGKWILGLGALSDSGLDVRQIKPAPPNDKRVDNFLLRAGDFLVSRSNTLDKVGRSVLFKGEIDNCSYPDLIMRFRVDESLVHPQFLEMYLRSSDVIRHFQRSASGTSESMVKITKSAVENLQIPLPPKVEQKVIASLLSEWDSAIEKTERLIVAQEKLFKCLLNNLITDSSVNGNWRTVKLGEVAHIPVKDKLPIVTGETLLTVKLHCKGIDKNSSIEPRLTEKGRPYFKRNAGEFLIGRQNFHNGGFGIVTEELDGLIASNAITSLIIKVNKIDIGFLFYFFARGIIISV